MKTLVLGGVKSGKSRFALAKAEEFPAPRLFLATAEAFDEEMAAKIRAHQKERGPGWQTLEVPVELPQALLDLPPVKVVLLDCLTVWLGNLFFYGRDPETYAEKFLEALQKTKVPLIMVSNEVGLGTLPAEPVARRYAESLGRLNLRVAQVCEEVYFLAAGCALRLK